jgi:hypothetical protein
VTEHTANDKRAAEELSAAATALRRAGVLFELLAQAILSDDIEKFTPLCLAEIGAEITETYGERAEGEAEFFADEAQCSSEGV